MISYNFVYRNMLVRRTGNICKIYDGHKLLIDLCYRNDEFIKIWIDGYMEGRKKWWKKLTSFYKQILKYH